MKHTVSQERPLRVAKEVQRQVLLGTNKVNVSEIARQNGYSKTSIAASKVQKSKTYRNEMENFVERLERVRSKALNRAEATVDKAGFHDSVLGVERLNKVHALLTGAATENIAVGVKALTDNELEALADGKPQA